MRLSKKGGAITHNRNREANAFLPAYSKLWQGGDTIHVFYPIIKCDDFDRKYDILAVSTFGYSIDPHIIKGLGIFVPSLSETENGKPIKPDILYSASKIARIIWNNEKIDKIARVTETLDPKSNEAIIEINRINEEHEKTQPVISKLKNPVSTECVVVKMNTYLQRNSETNRDETILVPDTSPEGSIIAQQDLSSARIRALDKILNCGRFYIHEDLEVLEVIYSYPKGEDKKMLGRTEPTGIRKDESILEKYPDHARPIKDLIERLASDDEVMFSRKREFTKIDESTIRAVLSSYFVYNKDIINKTVNDIDIDILANNYKLLDLFRINVTNTKLLSSIIEKRDKDKIEEEPPTLKDLITDVKIAEEEHESLESFSNLI